jgi:hypothetical protein
MTGNDFAYALCRDPRAVSHDQHLFGYNPFVVSSAWFARGHTQAAGRAGALSHDIEHQNCTFSKS